MNKVFIVQESSKNIEPAKKFGEVRVMLSYSDMERGLTHIRGILNDEIRRMREDDYILCIGDPVAIGIAIHYAALKNNGFVRILSWDKRRTEYDLQEIEL